MEGVTFEPTSAGAFIKGVDSSTGLLLQPRGSVPRGSNLLLTKRGSLQTCDGSEIVNAWNGFPTAGRGRAMCDFLFAPIGVSRYYLRIMKVLDQHLGAPQNLTAADGGGSGSSLNGTYTYSVTALDGTGGETIASATATASTINPGDNIDLTWNVVTNAVQYNIYRRQMGGFVQLAATIPQVSLGTATVTYTDTGATVSGQIPPAADTTQQTAMFTMPAVGGGILYGIGNQVALWPADYRELDGGIGGGSGGSGGTGGGNTGTPGVTPSGVYPPGNVSFIPQIVQFVNEACIALGNSYPPQIFRDPSGTPDNPAPFVGISSISVDAFGVVSITTAAPHTLTSLTGPGACVVIENTGIPAYNGCYQIITVPANNKVTLRNLGAIGSGAGATGILQITTVPIYNTFQSLFNSWAASTQYALGTIVIPATPNGYYYKVISPQAGGQSGASAPSFPTGIGQTVQDNAITWQNAGATADAAPPPPGAAHIAVYEGALWLWNTYSTNTSNGLDGPCVLRMSDVNNPNSWNPVNAAFLDKDDGFEGMGLQAFTLTAQGIPPQGSLVACKLRALYQILGVFGSSNFTIQRISTEMGCLAPRTLWFVSGYGLGRISHLGVSIFDGVNDRLISPQVSPYLFPSNDPELSDITAADANWLPLAWGTETANPAMYCLFIPVGVSNGALTRILCFDLVLKAWVIVDLPFPVSTAFQAQGITSNPVTLMGSYSDGTLQRWQAGDVKWATANGAGGVAVPTPVAWSVRSSAVASKDPEQRLYCRRQILIGQAGQSIVSPILMNPRVNGVAQGAQKIAVPSSGRFAVQAAVGVTSDMFDVIISGSGDITIDSISHNVVPKPIGVLAGAIS